MSIRESDGRKDRTGLIVKILGSLVLVAMAAALIMLWLGRAEAASGGDPLEYAGPAIDLYGTGAALPEARHFDLALGDRRPSAGMAEVILEGWDLDEPAEGSLQVGPCQPVPFPAARIAEHDSADGALTLAIPAICFRQEPGQPVAAIVVTHENTLGFRLTGLAAWLPPEPLPVAPRVSLLGWLQNEMILPAGFVPAGPPAFATVPVQWGMFNTQGLVWCAESTRGERAPRVTTAPRIVRRVTGVDPRLELLPEYCPQAWAACWREIPAQCAAAE